jgi:hypothetical protein
VLRSPTVQEQLELANQRQCLDIQIQKFEDNTSSFIAKDDSGNSWPDDADAKHRKLSLPSTYGVEKCHDFGVRFLIEKELILRQGQANDALHQRRIDLEHRSYLYCTQVRHAGHSQQKKTRAWDNVHSIEDTVKLLAAIYRKCRLAMLSLGAGPDLVQTYKELKPEDLCIISDCPYRSFAARSEKQKSALVLDN